MERDVRCRNIPRVTLIVLYYHGFMASTLQSCPLPASRALEGHGMSGASHWESVAAHCMQPILEQYSLPSWQHGSNPWSSISTPHDCVTVSQCDNPSHIAVAV